MRNFSELAERMSMPGVSVHMAIILGLVVSVLMITWHGSLGSRDFVKMEAETCSY